jgi:hypothetical protein
VTLSGVAEKRAVPAIKCLLDGDTPSPDVVELLKSDRWHLVEMKTGHWPMFSQPNELTRILLEAV